MKKTRIAVAAITSATLVFGLAACKSSKPSSQQQGQAQTEQAYEQQSKAVPYPADQLKDSQERRNIKERLLRTNNPNAISYLYILSFAKPLGYYVVKGKVTSTQSQMTPDTLVERHGDSGGGNLSYTGPGDDGSYGANEPGVFFFTTEGVMVTTDLDYIISDQPIAVGEFNVPKLNK